MLHPQPQELSKNNIKIKSQQSLPQPQPFPFDPPKPPNKPISSPPFNIFLRTINTVCYFPTQIANMY